MDDFPQLTLPDEDQRELNKVLQGLKARLHCAQLSSELTQSGAELRPAQKNQLNNLVNDCCHP